MEAMRPADPIEICRFFDLAIFPGGPGEMGRPYVTSVAGPSVVGDHAGKQAVERIGINAILSRSKGFAMRGA